MLWEYKLDKPKILVFIQVARKVFTSLIDRQTDGRMNAWLDRQTDGQTEKQPDGHLHLCI